MMADNCKYFLDTRIHNIFNEQTVIRKHRLENKIFPSFDAETFFSIPLSNVCFIEVNS